MTVLVLGLVVGAPVAAIWRLLGVAETRAVPGAGRAAVAAALVAVAVVALGMPLLLRGGDPIGLSGSLAAIVVSVLVAAAVVSATGRLTGNGSRG